MPKQEMTLLQKFAANVKRYRLKRGLSQDGLAKKVDCSTSHVSMLERALRTPSLDTIDAFADALGTTPPALLS